MAQKPSIPKGTRDFTPQEMANRNYIFNTIKDVFRLYGFQQIETPAMENLSTLMGKYGEEGDKLLFKILDSGDYLSEFSEHERIYVEKIVESKNKFISDFLNIENKNDALKKIKSLLNRDYSENETFLDIITNTLLLEGIATIDDKNEYDFKISLDDLKSEIKRISNIIFKDLLKKEISEKVGKEKGLRYDLTVPFARFVVQHQNEISFPFKRYQIQPVWRADRPQRGRYREFYQCDVDVVGSDSLLNELELIQIVDEVYRRLQINVCLKINNRKILAGIAEYIGEPNRLIDITTAIDKLDKIGENNVLNELRNKGFQENSLIELKNILSIFIITVNDNISIKTVNSRILNQLKGILNSEIARVGIAEIEKILALVDSVGVKTKIEFDVTLARGLNYYTGAIFEVKALDVEIGSITGGGRYDNLTGVFGMEGVSGVGISFGADRIYDVLNQLNLYPETSTEQTKILFVSFGEKELMYCLPWLSALRSSGINAEIYPEATKMKKQMSYADNKRIPFVAIVGETEMNEGKVMLKNMKSGDQGLVSLEEVLEKLR